MKKILLIIFAITLISCDPIISYQFNVENKSDKKLVFKYTHNGVYPKDSVKVCDAKTNSIIDSVTVRGSNPSDEGDNFLSVLDTLKLSTKDSSVITKNIYDRKNWKYTNKISHFGIIEVGKNIYTLKIENKDFLNK